MKKLQSLEKHTRYPIVLVHGIILKDIAFFKAFGRIEKVLKRQGYKVYTARIDGFGTIENNAAQLKTHIEKILSECDCDKVNLIAHSKGGLDSKYMINKLGGESTVASLTTLCTPHKGSPIASGILRLPKFIVKFIAFWVNLVYRIFGDKHPNSLKVCEQLKLSENADDPVPNSVYCQSYSATLDKCRDDFIMSIPLMFSRHFENNIPTDGLVSVDSSKFADYRGNIEGSVSHSEVVDFMIGKKKKERIYEFYTRLCDELAQKGF